MPESALLPIAVFSFIGYLSGSIPTARWVGGKHGVDPLVAGERNAGAANVWRLVGARAGTVVLLADMAKAAAPALLGLWIGGWWTACAGVVSAMAGHAWPPWPWSRFRGGRSVACLVGGGVVLAPLPAALAAGLFGLGLPLGLWRAAAIGLLVYPALFAVLVSDHWRMIGIGVAYLTLVAAWTASVRRQRTSSTAAPSSIPSPVRSRPIMPNNHSSPRRNGQQSNE